MHVKKKLLTKSFCNCKQFLSHGDADIRIISFRTQIDTGEASGSYRARYVEKRVGVYLFSNKKIHSNTRKFKGNTQRLLKPNLNTSPEITAKATKPSGSTNSKISRGSMKNNILI